MLAFTSKNGKTGVPNTELDPILKKSLKSIKNEGLTIEGLTNLSVFDKSVRYKNVYRKNKDGSMDIVINPEVVDELPTHVLIKNVYPALHVNKNDKKSFLGLQNHSYDIIMVDSTEIVGTFRNSLPIDEVETLLIDSIKKGVNYYG